MILPEISCRQDYVKVYSDTAVWLTAAEAICARHGLDARKLRRGVLGTHVVFRTGDCILKLFCKLWPDDFTAERAALDRVRDLPIPQLIGEGELEGWSYLIMSVVPGVPAADVWNHLEIEEKSRIVRALGRMMRKLHEQSPIPELSGDWHAFLQERIAQVNAHHGMDAPWRAWMHNRIANFREPPFDPVVLHADITEDHILLSEGNEGWEITGLIDFGDARMGHPHYDFIAPLACFTFGHPDLSRTLVEAYGLRLTAEIAEHLTTWCLLHEFACVKDFLTVYPVPDGPSFHRALWGNE